MSVESVASSQAASSWAVERSLRTPALRTWIAWILVGASGTYADKIHQIGGVSAYPNPQWIGELAPVSPAYVSAGVGFFALYAVVVGLRKGAPALFGGAHRTPLEVAFAFFRLLGAYAISAALGGYAGGKGLGPAVAAVALAAWAAPSVWRLRKTAMPLYVLLVVLFGVTFEWVATSHGAFVYPVCPSAACMGATIPLLWLPLLYVHVALFVHRMAGGPHASLV